MIIGPNSIEGQKKDSIIFTHDLHSHQIYNPYWIRKFLDLKSSGRYYIFDGGDMVEGTLFHSVDGGEIEADLAADIYDGLSLGNHGMGWMLNFSSRLPALICANVSYNDLAPLRPFIEIESSIGLILITAIISEDAFRSIPMTTRRGLYFHDPIESITPLLNKNRDRYERIFLISHAGLKHDLDLAHLFDNVDYLISSHCHSGRVIKTIGSTCVIQATPYAQDYIEINLSALKGSDIVNFVDIKMEHNSHLPEKYQLAVEQCKEMSNKKTGLFVTETWLLAHPRPQDQIRSFCEWVCCNFGIPAFIINSTMIRIIPGSGEVSAESLHRWLPFENKFVVCVPTLEEDDIFSKLPEDVLPYIEFNGFEGKLPSSFVTTDYLMQFLQGLVNVERIVGTMQEMIEFYLSDTKMEEK